MIYLDSAATAPVRREALEAAWPYLTGTFGNPSSHHAVGEAAANLRLSRQRASAVAEYLGHTFGIAPLRFEVQGFGESRLKRPEAPDADANRRVEIVLLD